MCVYIDVHFLAYLNILTWQSRRANIAQHRIGHAMRRYTISVYDMQRTQNVNGKCKWFVTQIFDYRLNGGLKMVDDTAQWRHHRTRIHTFISIRIGWITLFHASRLIVRDDRSKFAKQKYLLLYWLTVT